LWTGAGQVLVDLINSWIPSIEFKHNHRVDAASRQLADNCMAVARRQISSIVMDENVLAVYSDDEMPLEEVFATFESKPLDFQIVCWPRALRDRINTEYLKFNRFSYLCAF
jgi:ATP:corrinoid adenosyltransferase